MLGTYSSCKTQGLTIEVLLIAFLCEFLSSARILVELEFVRQGFVALDLAKLSSQVAATHENLHTKTWEVLNEFCKKNDSNLSS